LDLGLDVAQLSLAFLFALVCAVVAAAPLVRHLWKRRTRW